MLFIKQKPYKYTNSKIKNEGKIHGFRKKLVIAEYKIQECQQREVKSKIGHIFVNEKIFEEYSVKIYEIDSCFFEHYQKTPKKQANENVCKYILFKIDLYFTEYLLAVEIDEKGYTDKDLILEEEIQIALEKKLGRKFARTNTSKEGYDADYQTSRIQTFISKFKDRRLKKLNKKLKELEEKIEKLTGQTTQ